jgi:hypothetical protein
MAKKKSHKIHTRKKGDLKLRFALSYAVTEAIRTKNETQPIDAGAVKFLIERKVPGPSALIMYSRFSKSFVNKTDPESNNEAYETMAKNYHTLWNGGYEDFEAALISAECQVANGGKSLSQYRRKNDEVHSNILEAIANIQE